MSSNKKTRLKNKLKVYEVLGSECECCGDKETAFFTIDHRNSDGSEHRKKIGRSSDALHRAVLKEENPKLRFRLLCANCHLCVTKYGTCVHNKDRLESGDCSILNFGNL